ncbi:DUF2569 family protein [Streptomyces gulbargensis]
MGGALASHLLFASIWIPYFLKSRRVRATFTEE